MAIISIYFLLIVSLFVSSNKLINAPLSKNINTLIYITAEPLFTNINNYKIITILYKLYIYIVFDITYYRIALPGKYFKYFSLEFIFIFILKLIYHTIMPFIKYISYIINIILNNQKYDFWLFLYLIYNNSNDNRRLYYNNQEWLHNPFTEMLNNVFTVLNARYTQTYISMTTRDKIFDMFANIHTINSLNIQSYEMVIVEHHNSKINHFAVINNEDFKVDYKYLYITDLFKSVKHNAYDKQIIVPAFDLQKPSTILVPAHNVANIYDTNQMLFSDKITLGMYKYNQTNIIQNYIYKGNYNHNILPQYIHNDVNYLYNQQTKIYNILIENNHSHHDALILSKRIITDVYSLLVDL